MRWNNLSVPQVFPPQKKIIITPPLTTIQQYMLYIHVQVATAGTIDNACCLLGFIFIYLCMCTIHTPAVKCRSATIFATAAPFFFIRENYSTSVAYSEFMRRNDQKSEHISILDRNNGKLVVSCRLHTIVWPENEKQTHFFKDRSPWARAMYNIWESFIEVRAKVP